MNTIEELAKQFEEESKQKQDVALQPVENEVIPKSQAELSVTNVVGGVRQDILERAKKKINSDNILEKHADNIAKITDKAMEVDAERASLQVKEQDADNKIHNQEIKNRLIELKAKAKRLRREQKQLNKEQKAEHKTRNKQRKWEIYKDKLEKMGYSYVPCQVILGMLLFWDGVRGFFEGLGTVNSALAKAFKWLLILAGILIIACIILFSIPVTRGWLIKLFNGGH